MRSEHIGFLHPGAMGVSLAASVLNNGHIAYWSSENRSSNTYARAEEYQLVELRTIKELCDRCSVIISICPPHAAKDVALKVIACSFTGIYTDFNAISPQRVQEIGAFMLDAGIDFVDGGIIGPPAWGDKSTYLFLSGSKAKTVANFFSEGQLEIKIISREIGKASALKMCYAANAKGTTALLLAVLAAAEQMGIRKELETQWSRNESDFLLKTFDRINKATAKAWRFSGEMEEIASTFEEAGLPGEFHLAASDIFQRIALFKDSDSTPEMGKILATLIDPDIQG